MRTLFLTKSVEKTKIHPIYTRPRTPGPVLIHFLPLLLAERCNVLLPALVAPPTHSQLAPIISSRWNCATLTAVSRRSLSRLHESRRPEASERQYCHLLETCLLSNMREGRERGKDERQRRKIWLNMFSIGHLNCKTCPPLHFSTVRHTVVPVKLFPIGLPAIKAAGESDWQRGRACLFSHHHKSWHPDSTSDPLWDDGGPSPRDSG